MVNRSPEGFLWMKPAASLIVFTCTSAGRRTAIQASTSSPVLEFHAVDSLPSTRCSGTRFALATTEDTAIVVGTAVSRFKRRGRLWA